MTNEELAQQKRRLDEQLEVAISWLREAHRAQVRALEAAWAASGQSLEAPQVVSPPEAPIRRGSLEIYDEIVAVFDRLPLELDKNDVCRLLGYSPGRVALFRALQKLEIEGRLEVVEYGAGRRTTIYRRTGSSGAV